MNAMGFNDLLGRIGRRGAKLWRGMQTVIRTPALALVGRVSHRRLTDPSSNTVVSLTSYGPRLATVHLTIESIGRGRVLPGRLILWTDPGVSDEDLPRVLVGLRARGLEILASPAAYGPHTKYFPYVMSEDHHEASLVTADDDSLYPRYWLHRLEQAARGGTDVVCYRAHRIGFDDRGALAPYNTWSPVSGRSASILNFATGVSGVIYPPEFLDELARQGDAFLSRCPRADDVWLHRVAVSDRRGIRQLGRRPRKFPEVLSTQRTALHRVNTAQNANDPQIEATYSADEIAALRAAGTRR